MHVALHCTWAQASFCVRLAEYLVFVQNYAPSEITILTPYLGQKRNVKAAHLLLRQWWLLQRGSGPVGIVSEPGRATPRKCSSRPTSSAPSGSTAPNGWQRRLLTQR